jgi:hypothetical protein
MCGQVLQTAALISACVPYLREFLEAFPSGMFQPDEIRRRGLTYVDISLGFTDQGGYGTKGYALSNFSATNNTGLNGTRMTKPDNNSVGVGSMIRAGPGKTQVKEVGAGINVRQTVIVSEESSKH